MKINFFLVLSILVVLSGCAIYTPQARNVPMFKQAGEFQGAIQVSTFTLNAQTAVAATNHLAFIGNYIYGTPYSDSLKLSSRSPAKQHMLEGAVGYYANHNTLSFEVFIGYGEGAGDSHKSDDKYTTAARGKYTRYFLQPSFGIAFKKKIEIGLTSRISRVDFTELIRINNDGIKTITNPAPTIFFEPSFTLKINSSNNRVFGIVQAGLAFSDFNLQLYDPITLSVGLGIRLGGAIERKWKIIME